MPRYTRRRFRGGEGELESMPSEPQEPGFFEKMKSKFSGLTNKFSELKDSTTSGISEKFNGLKSTVSGNQNPPQNAGRRRNRSRRLRRSRVRQRR
jgi:hypothetical protein